MSRTLPSREDAGAQNIPAAIERARAGSLESLGTLAEQCRRYLLLVANHELGDELKAKVGASDLVQDTIVEAQRDFGQFTGANEAELRAWLRKILLNRVHTVIRQFRETDKRDIALERPLADDSAAMDRNGALVADVPTPSQQAVMNEEHLLLGLALTKLPEDYRQAIRLRSFDRLSFIEVGRQMGRSEDAAHKLWLRAIKRLQIELDSARGDSQVKKID